MAGASEQVVIAPPLDEAVTAATASQASVRTTPREDFRVRCTSKRAVTEILELCGRFVQNLGNALPEEIREAALRDLQWTFESAVQENVSINGQAWQEASDNCFMDSDIKVLEDQFDEVIVDIATKRKQYPRKILECVIKTLKARHEVLKQYRPVVHPLDLKCDPDPASRMENLKCRGETIAKEISEAMKTLPVLIEQADGFSQVLKMQPVIQLQRIHQDVFSSCGGKLDAQPESSVTQMETTPTESATRQASNLVLRRRRTADCPQRKLYPLRPKRINLDTEASSPIPGAENRLCQH
ncbi:kinetochore-associated protein NSL1 homolog [Fukomys damarensis]|uniref:Kinetochore-associated protein NSL1 like protein n=1 Tax=Fukomys damarensis TaxID=885580 RepID=A0A091D335_FUKDA|nr:kinetochore-associated protein NSL1 homolog [Fukomys damarensis]KFO25427.1 Kinetochore-associated protein NSL1 like protein [Fukomys damarensis]